MKDLPRESEPVKWHIEKFDWDDSLWVQGTWSDGTKHIVVMNNREPLINEAEAIERCKQHLRKWYEQRRIKIINADRSAA